MKKEYTISVFSEDMVGLLSRIVTVFTRRHINIESLVTSQSSIPGIYRFIIVVTVDEKMVEMLVKQLEKQVDVLKAFHYESNEIVYQEVALYKVPAKIFLKGNHVERIVRKHGARILEIEDEYIVLEKTGYKDETEELLRILEGIGILEFTRSGRVAITKHHEPLKGYLKEMEAEEAGY
ncbi:MAG: acetolactate synthase small subunit [Bacteroidota bacterium]